MMMIDDDDDASCLDNANTENKTSPPGKPKLEKLLKIERRLIHKSINQPQIFDYRNHKHSTYRLFIEFLTAD